MGDGGISHSCSLTRKGIHDNNNNNKLKEPLSLETDIDIRIEYVLSYIVGIETDNPH